MAGLQSKTYDPTVQAEFQLGLADSGRSTCRNPSCSLHPKRKIAKGSIRIARMEQSPSDHLDHMKGRIVPKWVHLECCAPVILQEAVDRYGAIEHVPGYDELEDDDDRSQVRKITANILEGIEAAAAPNDDKEETTRTSSRKKKETSSNKPKKAIKAKKSAANEIKKKTASSRNSK